MTAHAVWFSDGSWWVHERGQAIRFSHKRTAILVAESGQRADMREERDASVVGNCSSCGRRRVEVVVIGGIAVCAECAEEYRDDLVEREEMEEAGS